MGKAHFDGRPLLRTHSRAQHSGHPARGTIALSLHSDADYAHTADSTRLKADKLLVFIDG